MSVDVQGLIINISDVFYEFTEHTVPFACKISVILQQINFYFKTRWHFTLVKNSCEFLELSKLVIFVFSFDSSLTALRFFHTGCETLRGGAYGAVRRRARGTTMRLRTSTHSRRVRCCIRCVACGAAWCRAGPYAPHPVRLWTFKLWRKRKQFSSAESFEGGAGKLTMMIWASEECSLIAWFSSTAVCILINLPSHLYTAHRQPRY